MISRGRKDDAVQICGDDCRYRKLYEGSQRSLTEMAARQAQAVSRVGRLRNQLVLAAKRAFPKAFGEAEREIGKRMSEVTDEILVAYLESFMGSSILAEEPEGASELRQALGEIGIPIPAGVDLNEWAAAVRRYGPVDLVVQTQPAPLRGVERITPPGAVPNRSLVAGGAGHGGQPTAPVTPAVDLDLGDLFDDRPDTVEVKPVDTREAEVDATEQDSALPGRASTEGEEAENANPLDDEDAVSGPDNDFEDVFGGESIPSAASGGGDMDMFFDDAPGDPEPHQTNENTDPPVAAEGSSPNSPVLDVDTPGERKDGEGRQAVPAWATGRTVKPQLFPATPIAPRSGQRQRKPIRSRAIPADVPDVPIGGGQDGGGGDLTDDVRQRLVAATAVARPVFIADLEALVGSSDTVSAWRDEAQDGDLSVRFVLPKPRHRSRGALVIPQATLAAANSEFSKSHWARCIESYRGARIYELGVFFHRFLEQVISFESDGEVVGVRMSLPSGLTGAVLVAGQDLGAGGATRASMCSSLERLLRDRLVHVAVLVLNAEQFEGVSEVVDQEARARGWQANMPVTLSRSWEYVDGTGTAIPLLGV